jgi:serine/threonine-protein kinase
MLVGQQPFFGPDVNTILHQVMNGEPPPLPRTMAGLLPGEVEAVLRRALSKRQQDRFPTITAFSRAFEAAAALPSTTPAPRPRATPPKRSSLFVEPQVKPEVRRRPASSLAGAPRSRTWMLAVVLAAAVGIGVAWFTQAGRPALAPSPSSSAKDPRGGPTVVPMHGARPGGSKAADVKRRRPPPEK